MPLLDWTERKLDRAIISIGESFKTWFQEVWRLVFRVLVFWLSILLGFLHKPSFEKWVSEQRGRIRPTVDPIATAGAHVSEPVPTPGSADNAHPDQNTKANTFSPRSDSDSLDAPLGSQSKDALRSSKRKSSRYGRTAFADLLHTPPLFDASSPRGPLDSAPSQHTHSPRNIAITSQPSSYSDDLDLDSHFSNFTPRGPHAPSHRRATRPTHASDEADDDSGVHPATTTASNTHDDEFFDDNFEQLSSTSDDYDDFYGHKPKLASSSLAHPVGKHKHYQATPAPHRKNVISRSGSPGMPMFSMEDWDSSTSPLLQPLPSSSAPLAAADSDERKASEHFEAGASHFGESSGRNQMSSLSTSGNHTGAQREERERQQKPLSRSHVRSLSEPHSLGDIRDDNGSSLFDDDEDEESKDKGKNTNQSFLHESDFPPLSDTPSHIGTSNEGGKSTFQAYSVPIELEPPLVSKKSKSGSKTHQRARSMSPGGGTSRYFVSNPALGGTGRRRDGRREHFTKQRYSTIDIHRDRIFTSDKLNTGAMEDLRMWILLRIDDCTKKVRRVVKSTFSFLRNFSLQNFVVGGLSTMIQWITSPREVTLWVLRLIWNLTFGILIVLFYLPSRFLSGMKSSSFDKRSTQKIVTSQGYPYESYEVVTDDGYILKLERLPRPNSNRAIYFQHGVVDNSFAWFGHVEGEAGSALAFRAYDQGFDVFVGTFRGCEGSTRHIRRNIASSAYWDFSVNEHGMYDLKAFIDKIVSLKKKELGAHFEPRVSQHSSPIGPNQFDIMLIAHSMGAMASLIYLVWSKIHSRNHFISCAILLSPAGYHKTAPAIVNIMGPIINLALWLFPFIHTLKFPSETIRLLVSKILEDVNNSFTGRTMISWAVAKVIGGNVEDHTFVNLRNLTYNVFSGTSTGVFRHFWQIWIHKRFEGYDYGHAKNLRFYGTLTPIDFIDSYDKYVLCFDRFHTFGLAL